MAIAAVFLGPDRRLNIRELPAPVAGAKEIVVRTVRTTLCRSDVLTYFGKRTEPTPSTLGHESIGVIEQLGSGVSHSDAEGVPVKVGDRITWAVTTSCGSCYFCHAQLPQRCESVFKYGHVLESIYGPWTGGLATHVVLRPGTTWFKIPDQISDEIATPANCATATVAAVLRAADVSRIQSAIVFGAGMLGLTACAMLRSKGCPTIFAVDPNADCRSRALRFGASNSIEPADASEVVQSATSSRGTDLVLELSGSSAAVVDSLKLVRIGGTVVLAGTVAPVGTVSFEPEKWVRRMVTVKGVHNYHPTDLGTALSFLAKDGRQFDFACLCGPSFPLQLADQAFQYAAENPGSRVAIEFNRDQNASKSL